MTVSDAFWLTVAIAGGTALTAVTCRLDPLVRRWARSQTIEIRPIFAWYDLWVGAFYDQAKRKLYVFPVPCFGFYIQWR